MEKNSINENAKRTIREMKKALTPRLVVLYVDGKRRTDKRKAD